MILLYTAKNVHSIHVTAHKCKAAYSLYAIMKLCDFRMKYAIKYKAGTNYAIAIVMKCVCRK